MSREIAGRWLKVACVVIFAVGLGMAALAFPAASDVTRSLTDVVFGPGEAMDTPFSRLLAGIVGGVLAGWALTMWVVVDRLHDDDPELVRAILLPGLVVWFVIDSIGSVVSGGGLNVIGNLGFLVMFGVPLLARRRDAIRVG